MLLRQRSATLYRRPGHGVLNDEFACSRYLRGYELGGDAISLPPAADLHGLLLAYVAGTREDGTGIRVDRLSNAQAIGDVSLPHPMRVGSLRISRHGTVVWIGCTLPRSLWGAFRGDQRTPGIAPRSLRRHGNTMTWRHGGHRGSYRLRRSR